MSEKTLKNKNFEGTLTKFQENMLIITVMLGCFMSVLNMTNINIALPSLMTFFDTDMALILNENEEVLAIYQAKDESYVKPYRMFL